MKFTKSLVLVVFLMLILIPISINSADLVYRNRLVIPKIGVNAPVKIMGLNKEGRMDVPNNYTEVGLFDTVVPGEYGSAVMGAHVDNGGSIPGVFKELKLLQPGDDIFYYNDFGNLIEFQVDTKVVYDRDEDSTDVVFAMADAKRLNLITCYGDWLPKEKTYAQRLVVFTKAIDQSN
jgi:LPXTG-site transpeptidase (sortase) family protein